MQLYAVGWQLDRKPGGMIEPMFDSNGTSPRFVRYKIVSCFSAFDCTVS